MKRILSLIVLLAVTLTFCGCNGQKTEDERLNIVCASFAEYDWVKNLVADTDTQVSVIADRGTDMHSYQPTVSDVLSLSKADVVVYNGGSSDQWMDKAIKSSDFAGKKVKLMDVLKDGLILLTDDHHHHEGEDHPHSEYDEHVWLSVKNAVKVCEHLHNLLVIVDKENQQQYDQNYESYVAKLVELDESYRTVTESAKIKSVVFADRFPFVYLMNDYGIKWQAAFPGCSTETDADFEQIISLSKWIDDNHIKTLLIIEGSDRSLAKTVIYNTKHQNQQILSLDSMQSVSAKDISDGKSYLAVMQSNLKTLKTALG